MTRIALDGGSPSLARVYAALGVLTYDRGKTYAVDTFDTGRRSALVEYRDKPPVARPPPGPSSPLAMCDSNVVPVSADLPHYPCGHAGDQRSRRDVARDDRAGGDHGVCSDGHALQDRCAGAEPHVAFDHDRCRHDLPASSTRIERMAGVSRLTRGLIMTSSPISMPPMSLSMHAWLMNTLRPTRMFSP